MTSCRKNSIGSFTTQEGRAKVTGTLTVLSFPYSQELCVFQLDGFPNVIAFYVMIF